MKRWLQRLHRWLLEGQVAGLMANESLDAEELANATQGLRDRIAALKASARSKR